MKKFIDKFIKEAKIKIDNSQEKINFIREAYLYWEQNSAYDSTWTWAIIERDWKVLSKWTNDIPWIVWKKLQWRVLKWSKYEDKVNHAERNAIYNAAKEGIKLEWANMYMPWVPCTPCAIAIINSWIKSLTMHYQKVIKTPEDRLLSVQQALEWLYENDIELYFVNEKIGWCNSKMRGEEWNP